MPHLCRLPGLLPLFLVGLSVPGVAADTSDPASADVKVAGLADFLFQWEVKKEEMLRPVTQLQES